MQEYIIRRLFLMIPTLLGVSLIIFTIMRVIPGDVATLIATRGGEGTATEQEIGDLREKLGLADPLPIQYLKFVGGLLKLDVGESLWSGRPVIKEIVSRLPLTMELAVLAVLISLIIALPVGVLSAIRQDTWVDYLFRIISIAGLAMPNFWIGVLIILFLSLYFRWIPPLGYTDLFVDPGKNLQQMVWPAVALGYRLSAIVSRMTRSTMLEVLREDFIRTAWAKGLRERVVIYRHALKNALLPVITITGIQLGALMGGTVIMESIFTLPGVGRLLIDSINHRDYPVVQTIVVLLAFIFASVNLIVDMVYAWLNPRIRFS
ncbi:MAG: ABC transporter permease [Chloroflexi bacterium]|nr:ABC transporter permease [Chloroflexota bacterium]